jgi:hypothetical protein
MQRLASSRSFLIFGQKTTFLLARTPLNTKITKSEAPNRNFSKGTAFGLWNNSHFDKYANRKNVEEDEDEFEEEEKSDEEIEVEDQKEDPQLAKKLSEAEKEKKKQERKEREKQKKAIRAKMLEQQKKKEEKQKKAPTKPTNVKPTKQENVPDLSLFMDDIDVSAIKKKKK